MTTNPIIEKMAEAIPAHVRTEGGEFFILSMDARRDFARISFDAIEPEIRALVEASRAMLDHEKFQSYTEVKMLSEALKPWEGIL